MYLRLVLYSKQFGVSLVVSKRYIVYVKCLNVIINHILKGRVQSFTTIGLPIISDFKANSAQQSVSQGLIFLILGLQIFFQNIKVGGGKK